MHKKQCLLIASATTITEPLNALIIKVNFLSVLLPILSFWVLFFNLKIYHTTKEHLKEMGVLHCRTASSIPSTFPTLLGP